MIFSSYTRNDVTHIGKYWAPVENDRLECQVCPRLCRLKDGQRGMCFVRMRQGDAIVLDTYGRSSGFCIDPIEKKPLNHFYPGTSVLSFGTAGCNLACKFCQNHDMSKSREVDTLSDQASPEQLAQTAAAHNITSLAYTYNDPVIFLEYAVDTAKACQAKGVKSVAVTAGYIEPEPRVEFFDHMDAANVDLKAFTEDFYFKLTGAHLEPVLETLKYLVHETNVWVEITTLLIPGANDSAKEIKELSEWICTALSPDVPLHFTAFHPDFRMLDTPRTPIETLLTARKIAQDVGVHHVYIGNVHHKAAQSSYCQGCGAMVIGRDWHQLFEWNLTDFGDCATCGTSFPGRFDGPPGSWGNKRQRVQIR